MSNSKNNTTPEYISTVHGLNILRCFDLEICMSPSYTAGHTYYSSEVYPHISKQIIQLNQQHISTYIYKLYPK